MTTQPTQSPPDDARWLVASRNTEVTLIAFAAACLAAAALSVLGSIALTGHWRAFDEWMVLAFRSAANPGIPVGSRSTQIAVRDLTALGGTLPLTALVAIVASYLYLKSHVRTAATVIASSLLGVAVSQVLKTLVDRGRPDIVPQLVQEVSGSFPSGHAMMSALVYLTLGAMIARLEDTKSVRIFVMCVAMALPVAIGVSRVYLGVHWPTDVAAGWCLGALWVVAVSRILDAVVRREQRAQPVL